MSKKKALFWYGAIFDDINAYCNPDSEFSILIYYFEI